MNFLSFIKLNIKHCFSVVKIPIMYTVNMILFLSTQIILYYLFQDIKYPQINFIIYLQQDFPDLFKF